MIFLVYVIHLAMSFGKPIQSEDKPRSDSLQEAHPFSHQTTPQFSEQEDRIEALFSTAFHHMEMKEYAQSDDLLCEADARAGKQPHNISPRLRIRIKAMRAHLYELMGKAANAITCYESGILIAESHNLRISNRNAVMHNNLASLLKREMRWLTAEQHYKKALLILELLEGGFSPKAAALYHNLGIFYSELRNHHLAIRLLKRAYRIRLMCFGPDQSHPETKKTLLDLGATFQADGQWKEAGKCFSHFPQKEVDDYLKKISATVGAVV